MIFPKDFKDKKILVFGLGVTGISVIKFFKKNKINFSCWDDNCKNNFLYKKNLDKFYYKKNYDFIILSPGVNIFNHKKKNFFLLNKKKIITDLDIYFSLKNLNNYTIGVTGTNGKSTFCKLLDTILKKNKLKSKILGNYGTPILSSKISKKEICIIELSSYQIDYSKNIKLNRAIILNISPDHLERHKNLKNYTNIKFKIFNFLKHNGCGFFKFGIKNKKRKNIKSFNRIDNKLLKKILGSKIKIPKDIFNNITLTHRNENFYKLKNFYFINDSKSTNFDSVKYALKNYKNIILILGGLLKKNDNFFISQFKNKIFKVYLTGKSISPLIKSLIRQKFKFVYQKNLKKLLNKNIKNDFKINKKNKKIFFVLFSPGAASFDQYENYIDRGNKFKNLVYNAFKR
jgi:UDP-N-acetylmuramoylalanine--D-glutamate ligase